MDQWPDAIAFRDPQQRKHQPRSAGRPIDPQTKTATTQHVGEYRGATAVHIGTHTGETLVGKIGALAQIHACVQRRSLAYTTRENRALEEVKIMISSDVALAADKSVLRNAGHNDIHGREGGIDV